MDIKLETPKDIFLYLSEIYERCETLEDCYENGIDEFICVSIGGLINKGLIPELIEILKGNKPQSGHWCTRSEYWVGFGVWWDIVTARREGRLHEVFQDKSRFLKELADKL